MTLISRTIAQRAERPVIPDFAKGSCPLFYLPAKGRARYLEFGMHPVLNRTRDLRLLTYHLPPTSRGP